MRIQNPKDINCEVTLGQLRAVLSIPSDSREVLLRALSNCTSEVEQELVNLVEVAASSDTAKNDRVSAFDTAIETIRNLFKSASMGRSLRDVSSAQIGRNPETSRIAIQLESQEEQFAAQLRAVMSSKRISQVELARRSNCTQPAISQMLNRKCRPQRRTIEKLAEALDVAPTALWPDLEVADILDTVAAVQRDDEPVTTAEAAAIERAEKRTVSESAGRALPNRKR